MSKLELTPFLLALLRYPSLAQSFLEGMRSDSNETVRMAFEGKSLIESLQLIAFGQKVLRYSAKMYSNGTEEEIDQEKRMQIYDKIGISRDNRNPFHSTMITLDKDMVDLIQTKSFQKKIEQLTQEYGFGMCLVVYLNPKNFNNDKRTDMFSFTNNGFMGQLICFAKQCNHSNILAPNWLVWYPFDWLPKLFSNLNMDAQKISKINDYKNAAMYQIIIHSNAPFDANYVNFPRRISNPKFLQKLHMYFCNHVKNNQNLDMNDIREKFPCFFNYIRYLAKQKDTIDLNKYGSTMFEIPFLNKQEISTLFKSPLKFSDNELKNETADMDIKVNVATLALNRLVAQMICEPFFYFIYNNEMDKILDKIKSKWIFSLRDSIYPSNLVTILRNNVAVLEKNMIITKERLKQPVSRNSKCNNNNNNNNNNETKIANDTYTQKEKHTDNDDDGDETEKSQTKELREMQKMFIVLFKKINAKLASKETDNLNVNGVIDIIDEIIKIGRSEQLVNAICDMAKQKVEIIKENIPFDAIPYCRKVFSVEAKIFIDGPNHVLTWLMSIFLCMIDPTLTFWGQAIRENESQNEETDAKAIKVYQHLSDVKSKMIGKECHNCHVRAIQKNKEKVQLYLCKRCRKFRYCSRKCQKQHWNTIHRVVCR